MATPNKDSTDHLFFLVTSLTSMDIGIMQTKKNIRNK